MGVTRWRGDLHGLSRSAISAIKELADRSDPGGLALCLHRQAREFGDSRGGVLARQLLYFAENFGAAARIAALAFAQTRARLGFRNPLANSSSAIDLKGALDR